MLVVLTASLKAVMLIVPTSLPAPFEQSNQNPAKFVPDVPLYKVYEASIFQNEHWSTQATAKF